VLQYRTSVLQRQQLFGCCASDAAAYSSG